MKRTLPRVPFAIDYDLLLCVPAFDAKTEGQPYASPLVTTSTTYIFIVLVECTRASLTFITGPSATGPCRSNSGALRDRPVPAGTVVNEWEKLSTPDLIPLKRKVLTMATESGFA